MARARKSDPPVVPVAPEPPEIVAVAPEPDPLPLIMESAPVPRPARVPWVGGHWWFRSASHPEWCVEQRTSNLRDHAERNAWLADQTKTHGDPPLDLTSGEQRD